jgi:hypothetical protein
VKRHGISTARRKDGGSERCGLRVTYNPMTPYLETAIGICTECGGQGCEAADRVMAEAEWRADIRSDI